RCQNPEAQDAKRSVRGPAMPGEVVRAAAEHRHDVDVGRVRGEDESRSGSAPAAPKRCARERQREQRMRDVVHGLNVYRRDRKERRAKAVDVVLLYYRHGAAFPRAGPGRAAGTLESDSQILRFSHPQILKFLNLNRQAIVTAGLLLFLATPAAAQQPLASPPASPQFLSRYDFHLSAAALANDDQRFSWDAHFGG